MSLQRRLFVVVLSVLSFTLPALAADPLLIILDRAKHRAYIPEGSVIPHGMTIRVSALPPDARPEGPASRRGQTREEFSFLDRILKRPASAPLVFEYAPAERFTQVRRQYEAQQERRRGRGSIMTNDDPCYPFYASDSQTGYFGTYYNGFTGTFCQPFNLQTGHSYPFSFTASGDYTEDDSWVYPYAAVYDDNNNFNCSHTAYGYESPVECTASATTQYTGVSCQNEVHTVATLYVIEYLENYEPYYLGFVFDIGFCVPWY